MWFAVCRYGLTIIIPNYHSQVLCIVKANNNFFNLNFFLTFILALYYSHVHFEVDQLLKLFIFYLHWCSTEIYTITAMKVMPHTHTVITASIKTVTDIIIHLSEEQALHSSRCTVLETTFLQFTVNSYLFQSFVYFYMPSLYPLPHFGAVWGSVYSCWKENNLTGLYT